MPSNSFISGNKLPLYPAIFALSQLSRFIPDQLNSYPALIASSSKNMRRALPLPSLKG